MDDENRPSRFRYPLRLGALACLALLLLSYAWLTPALRSGFWLGIPRILLYLFGVWGLLIVLSAWMRTDD